MARRYGTPEADNTPELDLFLTAVEAFPVGTELSVENLRDELEAAQVRTTQYGPFFGAAERRGLIKSTGRALRCKKPSRKGGWAGIYVRTNPTPGEAA